MVMRLKSLSSIVVPFSHELGGQGPHNAGHPTASLIEEERRATFLSSVRRIACLGVSAGMELIFRLKRERRKIYDD